MTIQRARELLKDKAKNWTDEQVEEYLRQTSTHLDALLDVILHNPKNHAYKQLKQK